MTPAPSSGVPYRPSGTGGVIASSNNGYGRGDREKRRSRPQTRKIETDPVLQARARADLFRSRTPR